MSLHDPEIYIANMIQLLLGYPHWAGENAVVKVKRACKFVPTEAEVHPLLEDEVRVARKAAEWEMIVERSTAERASPVQIEERRAFIARRRQELGHAWGINDPSRPKPETRAEAVAKITSIIGKAAFDAIPDVPPRPREHTWQAIGELMK